MATDPPGKPKALIFQSYGWKDAADVAQRLAVLLRAAGYEVWIDRERIRESTKPEEQFPEEIRRGITDADVILVLISPHSTRLPGDADNIDNGASVCLNEVIFAHEGRKPIVPVIVVPCEPPFLINIVKRIDLSERAMTEDGLREGVAEILEAIEVARQRGASMFIPQLERLHPIDFRNELIRGARDFTGRKWLFDRLAAWLNGKGNCLVIEGDAGSGKSAIVSELIRRDPDGHMLAYHFCRADQAMTIQPAEFVRSLAAMIGGRIEAYGVALAGDDLRSRLVGDAATADPLSALLGCVINPLSALPPLGLRYIVVDALDEALPAATARRGLSIPQLLARVLPDLPPWLKLIVSTRRDERIAALFQHADHIRLNDDDPLQREDVARFLAKQFDAASAGDDPARAAERAAIGKAVIGRSAGNFLYAQQVAEAVDRGEISLGEVDALPTGLGAMFARAFQHHFPDAASYATAERLLGVILAAKQPLTIQELAMASGLGLNDGVRPVIEALTGYIVPIGADGGPVYGVFHKSLADWLTDPAAGSYRVDVAAGREQLLGWCRDWTKGDPYPLRYLIAHLLDAGAVDEALTAVRAGLFARREARMIRADLDDTTALTLALIERGNEAAVVELATAGSPWQRDGAGAALIAAPAAADPLIRRVVDRLASVRIADPENPPPEAFGARRTAMRVAEARSFDDTLLRMAKDKTPAVRIALATMVYRHWVRRREDGWKLIEGLADEMLGALSLPNGKVLEVIGPASLMILNNHRDEPPEIERLFAVWRKVARAVSRGPLVRTLGRKWTLDMMLRPLMALMKRQPGYQPFNAAEMAVSFARDDGFRRNWTTALACLERPEDGIAPLVEVLTQPGLPFDVYLMLVSERALICRGKLDFQGTFDAIDQLFRDGRPWFRQSALYALFHIMQNATAPDDDIFERYGAMTERFFREDGAAMSTSVASYAFAPHLAWPEIVAETHHRGSEPWLLPKLLAEAIAAGDEGRIETVFKAIDLVGFAYGRVSLALALVEKAREIGGAAVEARLVECLANIRFQDEALVDEFLEQPAFARLRPAVKATAPTIRGEDIPTWVDGFVVQTMLTSEDFHREVGAAFRRALIARSTAECLRQILIWVIGLLAGKPAYA